MSNWVKTKCLFRLVDEKENEQGFQRMLEDLHTDNKDLLVYWDVVDEDDRIYIDYDNVEITPEENEIVIPIFSSWLFPEYVIDLMVKEFNLPCFFSWCDEFENINKVDYTKDFWYEEVGSSGIGVCLNYDEGTFFKIFPPENERELHEVFLSSWGNTLPFDGGTRDFYNQNNIDDNYYYEKMIDGSFSQWLGELLESKISDNR